MKHEQLVITRPLPKTGQVSSYRTGDDGHFETGWWKGRLNADNKTRFVAKTLDGDDVVIDLATGLMWAADGNAAGCNNGGTLSWNDAIDLALILNFAGFTDWRISNIFELGSLIDYHLFTPSINESFFPNTVSNKYISSTTYFALPDYFWAIQFESGTNSVLTKTSFNYLRCVRGGV